MRVLGRRSNETAQHLFPSVSGSHSVPRLNPVLFLLSLILAHSFLWLCNFVHWQPPMQWVRGRHVVGWFWKSILGIGFSCYVLVFVLACQKTVVRPNLTRLASLVMSPILIKLIKYEMTCGDKVVIIQ